MAEYRMQCDDCSLLSELYTKTVLHVGDKIDSPCTCIEIQTTKHTITEVVHV